MKKIIRQIWEQPQFITHVSKIDNLLCNRRVGYQGTLAYAHITIYLVYSRLRTSFQPIES